MRMLSEGLEPLGGAGADDGGAGGSGAGEGGGGVCAAGMADVAWAAGKCSDGDGSERAVVLGKVYVADDFAAVEQKADRFAIAHLSAKTARRWGTRICGIVMHAGVPEHGRVRQRVEAPWLGGDDY